MANVDTIVIGASAGGVEALSRLVGLLPAALPATILVVVHFPQKSTSVLPAILTRNGPIPAQPAADGLAAEPGRIYCAPPGRHLLLKDDHMLLINGPKENGNRPAIDPLFRSAARARGNRVISVLLSGLLDDGTIGAWAVRRRGGITVCQDPDEAMFGEMPRHAIETGVCDHILTLKEIAEMLVHVAGQPAPELQRRDTANDPTEMSLSELGQLESEGEPTAFVCPECQGTLFRLVAEGVPYYRCRVGHSYLPDSLAANQEEAMEAALWTALRAIEEHQDMLSTMCNRAVDRGFTTSAKAYQSKMEVNRHRMSLLRRVLGLGEDESSSNHKDPPKRGGSVR